MKKKIQKIKEEDIVQNNEDLLGVELTPSDVAFMVSVMLGLSLLIVVLFSCVVLLIRHLITIW